MKNKHRLREWIAVILLSVWSVSLSSFAQGTSFTYQGRLDNNGAPANGTYDLLFTIYGSASGTLDGFATQTNPAVLINDGLFTVTLDFGLPGIFTGPDRWLDIQVRTNGSGPFVLLSPRQKLTPAPYAITAENVVSGGLAAGTYSNPVSFNNPSNSFAGDGSGLLNLNATTLNGFGYCNLPCYWNLSGNAGTSGANFLGTTDNQPLTLKVNNVSALQVKPGVSLPNWVAGVSAYRPPVLATNVSGVVIAGGGAPSGPFSGIGGGDFMAAFDDDDTIGGGFGNKVGSDNGDPTDAAFATVGGGIFNTASSFGATVAGGAANTAAGSRAVVAGGNGNQANGSYSSVAGGLANVSGADYATVGGGDQNSNTGLYGTLAGGTQNLVNGSSATVSGGYTNTSGADYATVGGGIANSAVGLFSTISGGSHNTAGANWATVAGGLNNVANGSLSFAAGRLAQASHQGAFVWADSQNAIFASTANDQFSVRAQGGLRLNTDTSLLFGNSGSSSLLPDQGGAIELGDSKGSGNTPYLDFHFGVGSAQDFNVRVVNDQANTLSFFSSASSTPMMRVNNSGVTVNSITITGGADLAEPFEMSGQTDDAPEGAVVVIDESHPGQLRISDQAYDTRVAGVLSGANGVHPAIRMQQLSGVDGAKNVALTGRVYVQADSSNGSIKPGDLLTTSARPGHAMRVSDPARAQGAILGKAMTGLSGGRGLVLVLVTLQ